MKPKLLIAFFALAVFAGNAVGQNKSEGVVTVNENGSLLRQTISRPITQLKIKNRSAVCVTYDTANYIDVWYNPTEEDPLNDNFVAIKGMTLIIDDPEGSAVYYVHLKRNDLTFIQCDPTTTVTYKFDDVTASNFEEDPYSEPKQQTAYSSNDLALSETLADARSTLDSARKDLIRSLKELQKTYKDNNIIVEDYYVGDDDETEEMDEVEEDGDDEFEEFYPIETIVDRYKVSEGSYFDFRDRFEIGYLWGFNNWGSQWYNGFSKMDGAYNLKTSFTSFQLEIQYAVAMTRHFNLSLGVGYETDIYHFTTALVDFDNNGVLQDRISTLPNNSYDDFLNDNQLFANTDLEDWSSKLVTRYVSLPVTMGLRFDEFRISLTALPALAITPFNTGLVHSLETNSIEYSDLTDVSDNISPYKLDVRLDIRYSFFGLYLQVATKKLLEADSPEVYPIKAGFVIKF